MQLLQLSFNNVHIHDCTATGTIKRTCLFLIMGRCRFISIVIRFRWIYFDGAGRKEADGDAGGRSVTYKFSPLRARVMH